LICKSISSINQTTEGAVIFMAANLDTGAVATEKVTYRKYVKYGTSQDKDGNTIRTIKESSSGAATDKKEPEKITVKNPDGSSSEVANPHYGMPVNWAAAERDGMELFSENEFVTYNPKSLEGVELLTPDPAVRLYIFQRGFATLQSAAAANVMKALKDTTEPEPLYTNETVDLLTGIGEDGDFSFNRLPSRRGTTAEEKLVKMLIASGASQEKIDLVLAIIKAEGEQAEAGAV